MRSSGIAGLPVQVVTLDSTGSLAMSLMMGGTSSGVPLLSRHRQLARSKRKPSTWYSSTHLYMCYQLSTGNNAAAARLCSKVTS